MHAKLRTVVYMFSAMILSSPAACGSQRRIPTPDEPISPPHAGPAPTYTGQAVVVKSYASGDFFYGYQALSVDANGLATRTIYDGLQAPVLGPQALSADLWERTKASLVEADLFTLDDRYVGGGTDCPEGSLSFAVDGAEKTMTFGGCAKLPDALVRAASVLDCVAYSIPCDATTSCDPNALVHGIARQPAQDCNQVLLAR